MVFRKSRVTKKRAVRRLRTAKGWYDQKYSAMDVAREAMKNVHYIKGMINCEKKFNDQGNVMMNKTPSTAGLNTLITAIQQGGGDYQREGNSVLLRSILMRARITANQSVGAPTVQYLRMIIYQDKNVAGSTPAPLVISDIVESGNVGTERAVLTPLSTRVNGRIKVLRDKLFKLVKDSDTSTIVWKDYFKTYTHLKFNGTPSDAVAGGAIYCLVFSDNDSFPAEIDMLTRVGYYDN